MVPYDITRNTPCSRTYDPPTLSDINPCEEQSAKAAMFDHDGRSDWSL